MRLRQIKALEGADGVWKDRDHPKLQQEAAVGGEAAREMAPRRRRSKTPAFTSSRIFLYVGRYTMRKERTMEVHFSPDVQAKLEQMARATGRRSDQLVENVVTDYFDDIAFTRETLDRRYDEMESGKVQGIDGEEVFARLRAKSAARRAGRQ